MPKSILSDSFEQIVELGKSTVKSTVQTMKGSQKKSQRSDKPARSENQILTRLHEATKSQEAAANSYTPLDMDRLENQYKNQDQKSLQDVREFFKKYKDEEKKIIEERKREGQERMQQAEKEEEEKNKKQTGGLSQVQAPKGKERKSIFSRKKVAKRSMVETRAGSGKQ